ncbi:MAG: flagellar hook-basal body complex protein FliE [Lachnospiraceae bacterium]|nr:flagellar hook-basal body complex protein FliE [Lachnospiraceae bacterium]
MPDVTQLRNISSNAIQAEYDRYRATRTANVLALYGDEKESFSSIFDKVVEQIDTTNNYLSDAENEEIRWALGETDSTHDLSIALQKAQTALQYTIAIRDRAIAAYREIIQMQI